MKRHLITVFFDGLCEPVNPGGVACYGFVIYVDGEKVAEGSGTIGAGYLGMYTSNNVAEYYALIYALRSLLELSYEGCSLVVKGDSQLVIRQLRGEYRVKAKHLKPLYEEVKGLLARFSEVHLEWVRREGNVEADTLSRRAYETYIKEHPEVAERYSLAFKRKSTVFKRDELS
ncbi:MAG: ribonuclease H [Thermoprotei archaeon]|nr:MAG: ribonuclease H [Thermoprotei archaeon]